MQNSYSEEKVSVMRFYKITYWDQEISLVSNLAVIQSTQWLLSSLLVFMMLCLMSWTNVVMANGGHDFDPTIPADYTENCPNTQAGDHMVVLLPHPDDEVLATFPVLQRAAKNGAQITFITLTDGGNGGDGRPVDTPNCNEITGVPTNMDSYFSLDYYLCLSEVRTGVNGEILALTEAMEALDGDPNNGNVRQIQFHLYDGWRESIWLGAQLDEEGLPPFLQLDANAIYWWAFSTGREKAQLKRALKGSEKNIRIRNGLKRFGEGNEQYALDIINFKLEHAENNHYVHKVAKKKVVKMIRNIIKEVHKDKPIDILYSFDSRIGLTGHPNHIFTGEIVRDAIEGLGKKSKPGLTLYTSLTVPGFSRSLFGLPTIKSAAVDPEFVVGYTPSSQYFAIAAANITHGDLTDEKDVRVCSYAQPPEPSEAAQLTPIVANSYPSQNVAGLIFAFDIARLIAPLSSVRQIPDPVLGLQKDSFAFDCLDFPDAQCLAVLITSTVFTTHEQLIVDDFDGTSDHIIDVLGSPNLNRDKAAGKHKKHGKY